jgi:UDP-glucose-4-epimerase GalE
MRVMLTGGAGYVGSACFRAFRRKGIEAFVFDDLSEGHAAAVEPDRLCLGDLRDTEAVARALRDRGITHVVHFAGRTSVPDSIRDPSGYWSVNVDGSRSLLEAMREVGIGRIVFSSTAAVYAHGLDRPIRETDPILPATPYGTSKLAVEHLLQGYADAYGFGATALRYFNACGADADGRHGEAHRNETHVIPLLIQTALGQRPSFRVFGDRWPTPDGTCVRDFVSVHDLAAAHLLALQRLTPGRMERFNLGSGSGTSVGALLDAASRLSGKPVSHTVDAPRPGDPAILVADIASARAALGWFPRYSQLRHILVSAWQWHAGGGLRTYAGPTGETVAIASPGGRPSRPTTMPARTDVHRSVHGLNG